MKEPFTIADAIAYLENLAMNHGTGKGTPIAMLVMDPRDACKALDGGDLDANHEDVLATLHDWWDHHNDEDDDGSREIPTLADVIRARKRGDL